MGKKRLRKTKTSRGLRPSVSNETRKLMRNSVHDIDTMLNKIDAWMKGKRGYVTINNPNTNETNKKFIKIPFSQYFGGTFKQIKERVKRADDKNKVEIIV